MSRDASSNPFPGLRPFEAEEDHLFFGRERETDELLRRLRSSRFLAVVGTSGSGKSSLVRCGLIPSLHSGFMATAGSSWRVSVFRPGEDPVGHLAAALDEPGGIGAESEELKATSRVLIEATLRRGSLGLVEAVRQAHIPSEDNLLVVVDQFEELFRYQRTRHVDDAPDDAMEFVRLLLEASAQNAMAIYVVVTMRSDFLGDCMAFPGLPEAVNSGLYLVPRMSRDNLRAAITGPVAVAGAAIAPRLVLRLLNDVGDDPDRLPVLQHALMRTWDHWQAHARDGRPIDLEDFEAVGTLRTALSRHADEACDETGAPAIVERMFKALTDTFADPRGTRRPTAVGDLASICETTEAEIIRIVEIFRRPGRSFLTPPADVPLTATSIVDLAHESLMRGWASLIGWAAEERQAATLYARVSQAATWWREGSAGLWRNPELELGLRWRRDARPTEAWAGRYHGSFAEAMDFLDRSEQEQRRLEAEREAQRRRTLRQTQWAAAVLAALLVLALASTWWAWSENVRAERNLALAREAVDEALTSASTDPSKVADDAPELIAFRRDLLGKAERFYTEFVLQEPNSQAVRRQVADGHLRLGHIQRMLDNPSEAERHYRRAIHQYQLLGGGSPGHVRESRALADTYNWLGETLRPFAARAADAGSAYDEAIALQQRLVAERPEDADATRDLARTHNNRGILRWERTEAPGEAMFREAEAEFRRSMALLEPLARTGANQEASHELARVLHNLATLLTLDRTRLAEVRELFERAAQTYEALHAADAANREYALALAVLNNNLAELLRRLGEPARALERSDRAMDILQTLGRRAASVAIHEADSFTIRGRILEPRDRSAALAAYAEAYRRFESVARGEQLGLNPDLELRFNDLIVNLAAFARQRPGDREGRRLLAHAGDSYLRMGREIAINGTPSQVHGVSENVARLWSELSASDQRALLEPYQELRRQLQRRESSTKPPQAVTDPSHGRTP